MQICGSVRGPASSSWLRLKSINGITLNGKDNIMLTHFHAVSFKSEKKNWLKIFSFFQPPSLVWDGGRKPPSQTVTQWSNESCLSIVMWHGYLDLVLVAHALLLFKKRKNSSVWGHHAPDTQSILWLFSAVVCTVMSDLWITKTSHKL